VQNLIVTLALFNIHQCLQTTDKPVQPAPQCILCWHSFLLIGQKCLSYFTTHRKQV